MSFIYLASPYTHPDRSIMEYRYFAVMDKVHEYLMLKMWVYSPILHCHEMAKRFGHDGDFDHWQDYDFAMLEQASSFHILCLEGWRESKGVGKEAVYAKELGMTIHHVYE